MSKKLGNDIKTTIHNMYNIIWPFLIWQWSIGFLTGNKQRTDSLHIAQKLNMFKIVSKLILISTNMFILN